MVHFNQTKPDKSEKSLTLLLLVCRFNCWQSSVHLDDVNTVFQVCTHELYPSP